MKKAYALLLIVIMLLSGGTSLAESYRLEGDGYASPEEAVVAYLGAMNQEDVRAMLATFAHETCVSHIDPQMYLRYARIVASNYSYLVPNVPITDQYSRSLFLEARYGSMATQLMRQYTEYCGELNGMAVPLQDAAQLEEYTDRFYSSPMRNMAGHIEFIEWVNPALLTQGTILKDGNKRSYALNIACYGADDVASLIAHIRVNGMEGLLFMECAKYGNRWYNLIPGGQAAFVMGIESSQQPLALAKTEEQAQQLLTLFSENAYADECAEWNALRKSRLAGTSWQLTQVNDARFTPVSDEAQLESSEGLCVYADLHFYGFGGAVIKVKGNAALRQQLDMVWGDAYIGIAWREANNELVVDQIKAASKQQINLDLTLDTVTLEKNKIPFLNENVMTFQFANGLTATFEKR